MKNNNRTIVVDFGDENQYQRIILNSRKFVEFVIGYVLSLGFQLLHKNECTGGSCFTRHSHYCRVKNNNITIWRIQCKRCKAVFTVIPSFLMRYLSHDPEQVAKALIAYHGGLSLENCSICFNISAMSLYRIICAFGKMSLVMILQKSGVDLPKNIQADEKHTKCLKEKGYIPIISSGHAIWHIDYVESLDEQVLHSSYQEFSQQARKIETSYSPDTATHDGFSPTKNSLFTMFKNATCYLICWLHSCWSIERIIAPFDKEEAESLSWRLLNMLKSCHAKTSLNRISLRSWFTALLKEYKSILPSDVFASLKNWIKRRKSYFYASMDHPLNLSFSYTIDHICNHFDRKFFMMKNFHRPSARRDLFVKGFALVHCFIPYQRFAKNARKSPAQVEGANLPHTNWFTSLQILTCGGYHKI